MENKAVLIVFTKIGHLLLDVQSTERAIKLCAKVALPERDELLSNLGARLLNGRYDKHTIGRMLSQLRIRATFQPDFEEILNRFLQNRNTFAHNLNDVPGWDLGSSDGVEAANNFMAELLADSKVVRSVFVGIINGWRIQSGYQVSEEEFSSLNIPDSLQTPIILDAYVKKDA